MIQQESYFHPENTNNMSKRFEKFLHVKALVKILGYDTLPIWALRVVHQIRNICYND